MKESRIRWSAMLGLVLAFGLSACGGDANGSSAAEEAVADAKEAVADLLLIADVGQQDLDCHRLHELDVLGLKDPGHASFADELIYAIVAL